MTPAEIEAIRARLAAATPGPWYFGDDGALFSYADGYGSYVVDHQVCADDEDLALIAAAPTDIATLLAHIDAQQAEIDRLRAGIGGTRESTLYRDAWPCGRCQRLLYDSEVKP